jgi:hypothetical protein
MLQIHAVQECSYCGRENNDPTNYCIGCGTALSETPPAPLVTPHHMARDIQQSIWEHFAVKRRQFYLAGFCIGVFGTVIGGLHDAEHRFQLWLLPVGGVLGVGAVWLLSFGEGLQTRIDQAQKEGNPIGAQKAVFVVLGLIALVFVALVVAGVCAYFLQ